MKTWQRTLEGFRYIHVIRHGLDVAFSKNQQQLHNWGPLLGVAQSTDPSEEPRASLQYWTRANQQVLQGGKQLGDDRFLLVNFDEDCRNPRAAIAAIMTFLHLEGAQAEGDQAASLVRTPRSLGRYKGRDLSQFHNRDLMALASLGYSIE